MYADVGVTLFFVGGNGGAFCFFPCLLLALSFCLIPLSVRLLAPDTMADALTCRYCGCSNLQENMGRLRGELFEGTAEVQETFVAKAFSLQPIEHKATSKYRSLWLQTAREELVPLHMLTAEKLI